MTLMGLVQNYHGLLIARIFLGVAEAGLYPGVAYYLTMWYCTNELAFRQALFFSAASIAGAFSGLLAYAIVKMDGVGGLEGWRWIFILEGLLTVAVAIFAFWALYDFPDTAGFLTLEEKAWVVHRLKFQGSKKSGRNVAESDHFEWKYVGRGMCFLRVSLCAREPQLIWKQPSRTGRSGCRSSCTGELSTRCTRSRCSYQPLSINWGTKQPPLSSSRSQSTSLRPSWRSLWDIGLTKRPNEEPHAGPLSLSQ